MGFLKPAKWKILFAILLLIIVVAGTSFLVWDYKRHINPDAIFQYYFYVPPGQPKSIGEPQKRVTFTIFRPTYKPAGFNEHGSLTLEFNDQFARLNYDNFKKGQQNRNIYGLQLEETKASQEQVAKVSKAGIVANNPDATDIRQIGVCESVGYIGMSKDSQDLIFIKDGTRILITYFTTTPIAVTPFVPLTYEELLHIACSLEPITVSQ